MGDPLRWIDDDKEVTLTLRAGDIQTAILGISAMHGEFCIMPDKCDCKEAEARIIAAWEKADPEPSRPKTQEEKVAFRKDWDERYERGRNT